MANVLVKDGAGNTKYLKAAGAGSDVDPFILDKSVTLNAGTNIAGKVGIDQTTDGTTNAVHLTAGTNLAGKFGIDQVTANANEVVVKSGTVTAVTGITNALPAGTNLLGKVGIDQVTANANEVVVKSGTVTAVTAITNALPAGENHIGQVSGHSTIVNITPVLSTDAYGAGDLLFDATEIASACRVATGKALATSIAIIDKDDQGAAMDLYFWSAECDMGTTNSAVAVADDANLALYLGHYSVAAGDYKDLGPGKVAIVKSSDLGFLAAADSGTSLYLGGVTQGTPTHTSSGLVLRVGLMQD